MSTLVSIVGSGAGLVVIAVAMILGQHYKHLPSATHAWVERALAVVMYCGGTAVAVTGLGHLVTRLLDDAAGWFGGINAPLPRTAFLIAAIVVIAAVAVSLIWEPDISTGMTAAFLPILLGMVSGGVVHQLYVATVVPGQSLVTALNSWLGG